MIYIYSIINKVTGKRYIGVSKDPNIRFKEHCKWTNPSLIGKSIRKHGKHNFNLSILSKAPDYHTAYILEKYCVHRYNSLAPNGYNLTSGGVGCSGISDVMRKKMSISAKKRIQSLMATTQTEQANEKRANTVKEIWKDPEYRLKMIKANIRTKDQIKNYTLANRKKAKDPVFIKKLKESMRKVDSSAAVSKGWITRRANAAELI